MRFKTLLLSALLVFMFQVVRGEDESLNKEQILSLNTGSFVYHAYSPHGDFTQYFENKLIAIERRMSGSIVDGVVLGTFVNSNGNRCLLLGVQKNWIGINPKTTFEGVYAYAGEFFFEPFSNCGTEGYYNDFKKATGIGFAPYAYHGIEYDLSPNLSLEGGVILPGILIASLQWHF